MKELKFLFATLCAIALASVAAAIGPPQDFTTQPPNYAAHNDIAIDQAGSYALFHDQMQALAIRAVVHDAHFVLQDVAIDADRGTLVLQIDLVSNSTGRTVGGLLYGEEVGPMGQKLYGATGLIQAKIDDNGVLGYAEATGQVTATTTRCYHCADGLRGIEILTSDFKSDPGIDAATAEKIAAAILGIDETAPARGQPGTLLLGITHHDADQHVHHSGCGHGQQQVHLEYGGGGAIGISPPSASQAIIF